MVLKFYDRTVGLLGLLALAAFAACGSTNGTDVPTSAFEPEIDASAGVIPELDAGQLAFTNDDAGIVALAFDPPSITLTVDGKLPQTASFTLKATREGGATSIVTADALQFDRPDLATMTRGAKVELTAPGHVSGRGVLHGIFGGREATATLDVVVKIVDVGAGVSQAIVSALGAASVADPVLTSLAYPYDKTVFPLGLASPLLMWSAPNASDVYRVHLEESGFSFDGYYTVPQPAQRAVDQAIWDRMTASNTGDPVALTLARYDVAQSKAYASAREEWTIAPASMQGAIYYWTTSAGGHMSRIRPGSGAQPEVLNGGKCMGCHAVSADGTTLVAAVEGQPTNDGTNDNRAWVSFDLPAGTVSETSTLFAGNVALNPNGKYVVFGSQKLKLGSTKTGQVIATSGMDQLPLGAGMLGFMTPAFSPDGKKLAMVEGKKGTHAANAWYHNLMEGRLVVVDFDEPTEKVSSLKGLVPASFFPAAQQGIAYPTFAPDSASIAFHVGDYTTGCDLQGCDDKAKQVGAIWMQKTDGSDPVRLTRLTDSSPNAADRNLALEPTFNPVERGGYYWIVFTSARDWGNRIVGAPDNGKKRLWVAAIDKTTGTTDPSHPPFFLEGQEESTTNMRGFWALAQCTQTGGTGGTLGGGAGACKAGFECCSGFCDSDKGVCVDKGTLACVGVAGACTADSDCCNAPVVRCASGACQPQIVK